MRRFNSRCTLARMQAHSQRRNQIREEHGSCNANAKEEHQGQVHHPVAAVSAPGSEAVGCWPPETPAGPAIRGEAVLAATAVAASQATQQLVHPHVHTQFPGNVFVFRSMNGDNDMGDVRIIIVINITVTTIITQNRSNSNNNNINR